MCGGNVEFESGATVGVCDSCGTKQTLPRLDDDRRANLYDRANHFRRNNEFDKAVVIYEQILTEDTTDAEAYWSLVLCQYGIEYVEDPATHKRVPTINRAQFTSIFDDDNYKSALQYADGYQRELYEKEAKMINDIQKGILAISQKEEPFDVFICYKETDNNGRRTPDSVLANDLYHQLTQEGFKVFFARITLEDKLGTVYEPYIFAALNSSKVMVVLGTNPEHFNAVWVKNEWSRYLALVKKSGGKKILIPAYKDMDPYDLPEEFSHLQAQDMSKLGFMQDLIRGIKKIAKADEPKAKVKETVVVGSNNANVEPLLERAFLFLEDGKWQDANIYCEKVLDIDPKNAEAYLGKLMADLQVRTRKQLADCAEPFDGRDNYSKVLRFGDESLEKEMRGYITYINECNENARLTGIYENAQCKMQNAESEEAYKKAAEMFKSISSFKDAGTLVEQCLENAEVCRKDAVYSLARSQMSRNTVRSYEAAINTFYTISGWKDADEQVYACKRKVKERRISAEKAAKKCKKAFAIGTPVVCACIVFLIVRTTVIIPNNNYNAAIGLYKSKKYNEAIAAFKRLDGYKDSMDKINECNYLYAIELANSGNIIEAYETLIALDGYGDSAQKASEIYNQYIIEKMKETNVGDIVLFGKYEQDSNTLDKKENIEWQVLAKEKNKILLISKYALACRQYNDSYSYLTWKDCSLRSWLNGTFLNDAFSTEEQSIIQSTIVYANRNPEYSTDPGASTTDKVFLLSIDEAEKYFSFDRARRCNPTQYAVACGVYADGNNGDNCWWWLRSPGEYQSRAATVHSGGDINYNGTEVNLKHGAVRPALWIDLGD